MNSLSVNFSLFANKILLTRRAFSLSRWTNDRQNTKQKPWKISPFIRNRLQNWLSDCPAVLLCSSGDSQSILYFRRRARSVQTRCRALKSCFFVSFFCASCERNMLSRHRDLSADAVAARWNSRERDGLTAEESEIVVASFSSCLQLAVFELSTQSAVFSLWTWISSSAKKNAQFKSNEIR